MPDRFQTMGDALESEEFFELMQEYRNATVLNQTQVIAAFDAVKAFILAQEVKTDA